MAYLCVAQHKADYMTDLLDLRGEDKEGTQAPEPSTAKQAIRTSIGLRHSICMSTGPAVNLKEIVVGVKETEVMFANLGALVSDPTPMIHTVRHPQPGY